VYPHLTLQELKAFEGKLGKSTASDVTGGMLGKVTELIPAVEQGIPVAIVNAAKPNRLYRALIGEKVEGTIMEKG
jgi:isopentenyl phosphate kinase